ncbi:hypothetical protein [Porphyromonas loveana]|uniref:hypothetical protein n=1 Tax=Porphyromonas loveana TaxID=1884669 RepID=UPI00359FF020
MMIIKINKRLHLYIAVLIHQIRLRRAISKAKQFAHRSGERAIVLLVQRKHSCKPQAVRWSKIPPYNRSRLMRRALYVASPNGTRR